MRLTAAALRITLVTLAGALAAACAHVVIDIAGDYLLAHDAYDGVAHHSRGLLLAVAGIGVLALLARVLYDALDRQSTSKTSLLALLRGALRSPLRFAAGSALTAVILLPAMEWFDCASLSVRVDDPSDLFGGSLLLGLTTAIVCGTIAGALVARLARLLADFETAIVELVSALLRIDRANVTNASAFSRELAAPISRRLLLGTDGRKRGPPLPAPA